MLEVFLKVMDKIHIKEIAFSVLVVCGIILFAPNVFMEKLGLSIWRNKYRSMVGLIFLLCSTCCIIWIFIFIKNQIFQIGNGNWRLKRISKRYLKSTISSQEKDFLMQHYYGPDRNEFLNTARVDMTSGNVVTLANAYIIVTGTRIGHGLTRGSYNLQPNVKKYLNKAIRKKKIVVGRDGYTWKL